MLTCQVKTKIKIYPCIECNSGMKLKMLTKGLKFTRYYVKCSKCNLEGLTFLTRKCAINDYNDYYNSEKAQEAGGQNANL